MGKEKKFKFFFGSIYLLIICIFLWLFFNNFSLFEITSYDFIKNNRNLIIEFKNSNFFITTLLFIASTILWVLLLGFGSPICLLSGFIFGKWTGTILALFGLSIGATMLYIFANYFLKEIIERKFSSKFSYLEYKFKKNEFNFLLIYRFIGGIPFFLSNILPTLFKVKIKNFFFATFLGLAPQVFVISSLGSGLEKIIDKNLKPPSIISLIFKPEIYFPIMGFIFLLIIGIILKKLFYKN